MAIPALKLSAENPVDERFTRIDDTLAGLDKRVARLELTEEHIFAAFSEMKVEMRRMNDKIDSMDQKFTAKFDEHSVRFDEMDRKFTARLDGHSARFDEHTARFDDLDTRFDDLDTRFDDLDARFDAHDARFDAHDARFDRLEQQISALALVVEQGFARMDSARHQDRV